MIVSRLSRGENALICRTVRERFAPPHRSARHNVPAEQPPKLHGLNLSA